MSINEQNERTAKDVMPLMAFVWLTFTVGLLVYFHHYEYPLWLAMLPSGWLFLPVGINLYQAYSAKAKKPDVLEWYLSPIFYMPFILILLLVIYWDRV